MKTNFYSSCLILCLLTFACLVNSERVENKKSKLSPTNIKNSPKLIENKMNTNESLKAKILKEKKNKKMKQQPSNTTTDNSANTNNAQSGTTTKTSQPSTNGSQPTTYDSSNSSSNYQQQSSSDDNKYFYKKNIVCSQQNCQLPNGVCTDDNTTCKCLNGYANFEVKGQETYGYYCTYVQKKQLVAFLLEFFVSSGVGHFYAGRTLFGVMKLLVCIAPILISILMCCAVLSKDNSNCWGLFVSITSCGFVCAALVWQLVDIIMFGLNKYKDGNGVPLQHW